MRCDKALRSFESADDHNRLSLGKPNECDVAVSEITIRTTLHLLHVQDHVDSSNSTLESSPRPFLSQL